MPLINTAFSKSPIRPPTAITTSSSIASTFARQVGENWIKIKDDVEADSFDWDSKTVEDGRYEIKITATTKEVIPPKRPWKILA